MDPLTREALTVLLDAFDTPDPADTPAGQQRTPSQRRHDAFAAMLHTLLAQPGLPTVQGARPQILITIDLAALLGLPPDHPAAAITLADLAAWLGIDLPDLTDADPDADADADADLGADPDPNTADTHEAGGPGGPEPDAADTADTHEADGTGEAERGAEGEPGPGADGAGADALGADPEAGADTPGADGTPPARPPPRPPPRFGSGVPVSPTTVRGLVPAATIMAVLTLGPWRAVNVGSKHRTLPAWLRTVLAAFHAHCRGPDCDRRASWTEAHHITPWATARTTDLNDTLPCCPTHHDLIDEGWTATLDHTTGNVTWTSPTGRVIVVPPPTPWPFG